ncbi:peptide-methionine (S)-S-oxide reductase MsrA [Patescibacteria group bacterium]|nr:peptide-methionine (S)-S-oxide reductase MsrA [Patescibacteria group bacterium]
MTDKKTEVAVFGGGCFWCTEAVFSRVRGILSVTSGYAGGKVPNPTYFQVSEELTGHAEVVRLEFDPSIITYNQLLDIFWHVHDPTTLNQQGADVGTQYRSIILYTTEEQKEQAEAMRAALVQSNEFRAPVVTQIQALDQFFTAEEYHQKYYERNQDQPYCQVVITPKIEKLLQKYGKLIKKEE